MTPHALGALELLGLSLAAAALVHLALREWLTVRPGLFTRVFAWAMVAHAALNLIGSNHDLAARHWDDIAVADLGAAIYLLVYLNMLRRHAPGPILLGLALVLGSYVAYLGLIAARLLQFGIRLMVYETALAVFALAVLAVSGRRRS